MATINRFEDLEIWKEARRLFRIINYISSETNLKFDYKLKEQIRESSGSVMDNIAEGFERDGNMEFRQFLSIAKGSAGETRSQLYRLSDCNYISTEELNTLVKDYENLNRRISSFITYLNKKEYKGNKFK
jgi:four helix bundle protein